MRLAIAVCTTAGQRRHVWLDSVRELRFFLLIRTEARGFLTETATVNNTVSGVWTSLFCSPVMQILRGF